MMPSNTNYLPNGVIPAILLPFNEDLSIDEAGFRSHLADIAATEGISAITINAHASEVASCTFDEQRRVLDIAQDEIAGRIHPLARVFYAEPAIDMHNRMKEALVLLGRQRRAVTRPPLIKLDGTEIERIKQALIEAGLLLTGDKRVAA